MTAVTLKKKIHECIDNIEDNKILDAVYTLLNSHLKQEDFQLSDADKRELDYDKKQHKAGKSKSYTVAEVREYAYSKLKK